MSHPNVTVRIGGDIQRISLYQRAKLLHNETTAKRTGPGGLKRGEYQGPLADRRKHDDENYDLALGERQNPKRTRPRRNDGRESAEKNRNRRRRVHRTSFSTS